MWILYKDLIFYFYYQDSNNSGEFARFLQMDLEVISVPSQATERYFP